MVENKEVDLKNWHNTEKWNPYLSTVFEGLIDIVLLFFVDRKQSNQPKIKTKKFWIELESTNKFWDKRFLFRLYQCSEKTFLEVCDKKKKDLEWIKIDWFNWMKLSF